MKALMSFSGNVAGFREWLKGQKPDKVVSLRRRKAKGGGKSWRRKS